MRRTLRIGAGLGLALVVITCTERGLTGPHHPGSAAFDFSAWAPAATVPGAAPVPIDSLEIVLQRASDGSVALDKRYGFNPDTLKGDSLVVNVDLSQSPEAFTITIRMYGGGIDWYHFTGSVDVTAGAIARPSITGQYVGTGANATRVVIRPADTTAVGGTVVPLRALAFDALGDSITGVPIGYRLGDSTRGSVTYPTPYSASLTVARSLRDSVWVVAETPTHLKDSTRVHLIPQPAQLIKVAGDNQTGVIGGVLGAPLVVRVLDALGGGFKGDSVRWSLSAGSATLSAAAGVTDDTGYAVVHVTPTALGSVSVQATAKAISGPITGSPVSFLAMAGSGAVKRVAITPKIDTVAFGATVQYTATLYDSLGNVVTAAVLWSSTATGVATVDPTGLVTTLNGDSTKIIASSSGVADTARLYVRVLRSLGVSPADTVITAVGDSVRLKTTPVDNFGAPVSTGLKITFATASPSVVQVDTAGKVRIIGPGNGVVLAKDSVAPGIVVQGSATLRVNQVTFGLVNNPKDSVIVGVSGQTQILAAAVDSNGYVIPGKSFSWVTRPLGVTGGPIANVTSTGLVTGVALGSTYAVDTLVEGARIFKDSTKVVVTAAPPKLLQWAFDSTAVGNGGNVSIGLAVTAPPIAPLTITITSTDTTIAKANPNTVTIGTGVSATSVTIYGLKAGRTVLTATDASGLGYSSKQMVVGVVSTITFREIANPCCQQQYFYLNQNETHKAQVWLSDPAPAGGLGITFVYGRGLSAVTPSPAVIPAGQLSADITFQGLAPGQGVPDSVVPTSGGYIGKFSYVYVAPDSLRLNLPYPYNGVLGVGQVLQPTVSFTYQMDHPLLVSATLSSANGVTQPLDTLRTGTTSQTVTVTAKTAGSDTLTLSAPGWVSTSAPLIFTTPHLGVSGSASMVAGDPSHGYWTASPQDSLRYGHAVADTLRATLTSRDTTVVAVDSPTVKVLPGNSAVTTYSSLRAQPGAGGRSVYLVASAPGYTPDSFLVNVTSPALTIALSYPYDGRVAVGTFFQNAGYVSIPYVRPDTLWVVFQHTRKNVVAGPDSAAIPKGSTIGYFNTRGDTLSGTDTMTVARATGYTLPPAVVFHVDSIHVRPYNYPSQLFTISAPQQVSASAYDAINQQSRPLVAPLRVTLAVSDTALRLDSAAVTITAGTSVSNVDTLRVHSVDSTGVYLRTSAAGSTPDSAGPIKVLATPLTVAFGYPYVGSVGRGLELQSNYISIPAAAPNTVTVALQRFNPTKDSLAPASALISKGSSTSQPFSIVGLDSTGTDSMIATAPGFTTARATITPAPVHIALQGVNTTHLTTEPPLTLAMSTVNRSTGYVQPAATPDSVSVQSSDSTVIRIDSAATLARGDSGSSVVAAGQSSGSFRVRFVGSGTARIRVSARGFSPDSSALISVTGPSLNFGYTTVTAGVGQVFQSQYVQVNNAITGNPLVVRLQKSDSQATPGIFGLASDSVIIPVGSTVSPAFSVTGQTLGSAQLIARASGYNQATASVSVGTPRLATSSTLNLFVGAPPMPVPVYAEDQTGATRVLAATLTVGDSSTAPLVAAPDSTTFPIAALSYYSIVGVKGLTKGSAAIVFYAPGYRSDTLTVSVDTAPLVVSAPPTGLGVNQTGQMTVAIPFATPSAVTVTLGSSNPAVLTVPNTVTIPANNSIATFNVTGASQGTSNVTATATGFYAATPISVAVGQAKLAVSFSAAVNVGQKNTLTVFAEDASGNVRAVTQPVTITLASSGPGQTVFDSATITIPVGGSSVSTGVTFDSAGTYGIVANASGYSPANVATTASGVLVTMVTGNQFSPSNVTISAGQYVTWMNNDAIVHTTTSDTPQWDSGDVLPGASYSVYFPTPGTYTYHCTYHGALGMTGTVTVQ